MISLDPYESPSVTVEEKTSIQICMPGTLNIHELKCLFQFDEFKSLPWKNGWLFHHFHPLKKRLEMGFQVDVIIPWPVINSIFFLGSPFKDVKRTMYNLKWIPKSLNSPRISPFEPRKTPFLLSIESWLVNRDPYIGLLKSPYNWVV